MVIMSGIRSRRTDCTSRPCRNDDRARLRDTMGTDAHGEFMSRFRAAISPSMLPPRAMSITGKRRVSFRDVASDDDVRSPEKHGDIAVGMRGRLVQHLDRLAVQVQKLLRVVKGFRGKSKEGARRCCICRYCHMPQHALGREDGSRRSQGVRPPSGGACAWKKLIAGLRQVRRCANMVVIGPVSMT